MLFGIALFLWCSFYTFSLLACRSISSISSWVSYLNSVISSPFETVIFISHN